MELMRKSLTSPSLKLMMMMKTRTRAERSVVTQLIKLMKYSLFLNCDYVS